MKFLVSNDDGVYAPGLEALAGIASQLGEARVVAPMTEQSGVGHAITFLTPLIAKPIRRRGGANHDPSFVATGVEFRATGVEFRATGVDGSPADCVKLALGELMKDDPPDLVLSGINSGLNSGINVLYSGTVAAAIEGAFFGVTSIAVSLEHDDEPDYAAAAERVLPIIRGIVAARPRPGSLFNINVPTAATRPETAAESRTVVVPMGLAQYGRSYERRVDPQGNPYYWALWTAPEDPPPEAADIVQLRRGHVTVTPLHFDLTDRRQLEAMADWNLDGSPPA